MRILLLSVLLHAAFYAGAQKVETDISACRNMLLVLQLMKSGAPAEKTGRMLDSVLNTRPYRVMFEHYNRSWRPNHLPEEVFRRMVLSLNNMAVYSAGENQRADAMLRFWKKAFENTEQFRKDVLLLEKVNLSAMIQQGVREAQKWLPASMKIPDFYFFIHPNGGSTAFAVNGSQGYDFFQLERDSKGNIDVQKLADVIAHESHHTGLKPQPASFSNAKDSLAFQFLMTFVAEGTASKFVDNLPGGSVPAAGRGRSKNFDTAAAKAWAAYTGSEKELFRNLEMDFRKMYSGEYNSDSVQRRMAGYWLGGQKGRAYFLGAELFGAVYHSFGLAAVFYIMEYPQYLLKYYNRAAAKLRKKYPGIVPLSNWLTNIL